jgi:hypothetical protein
VSMDESRRFYGINALLACWAFTRCGNFVVMRGSVRWIITCDATAYTRKKGYCDLKWNTVDCIAHLY